MRRPHPDRTGSGLWAIVAPYALNDIASGAADKYDLHTFPACTAPVLSSTRVRPSRHERAPHSSRAPRTCSELFLPAPPLFQSGRGITIGRSLNVCIQPIQRSIRTPCWVIQSPRPPVRKGPCPFPVPTGVFHTIEDFSRSDCLR